MIRKYPKPVLCNDSEASFYKPDICFTLNVPQNHEITHDSIVLHFSYDLNSSFLIKLLENEEAKLYYKVKTNRYSKMFEFDYSEKELCHYIKKDILDRIDKIQLSLFVIANCDLLITKNDELIDDVSDYSFFYTKGELLGLSNEETLNYSLTGNPFINISLAESQENHGLAFSSQKKEVIQIKVGPSLNAAYTKLQRNNVDAKDILNPFLAFISILYAIEKAISDEDKTYKDKDWFKILDQSFDNEKYDSLEEFIDSLREGFDADVLFKEVQEMLNNSLETKIRIVADRRR